MAHRTPLFDWHNANGGRLVDFAGWELPVFYPNGIITEHLTCRKYGGLFDISHMGRFLVTGEKTLEFLNAVLTANAARLTPGLAQYTLISNADGQPLDDAYLYRFKEDQYLLVVNGANREKDWAFMQERLIEGVEMKDLTFEIGMVALQGPNTEKVLTKVVEGEMPVSGRNHTSICQWQGKEILVSRTGYTGEIVSFELFMPWDKCVGFWEALLEAGKEDGIVPVGLGARDTLRLEACLPLYGHELAQDRPLMSYPQARFGVNFSEAKGDYVGKAALAAQKADLATDDNKVIKRFIYAIQTTGKGMIREGSAVMIDGNTVGEITSGTMVPAWEFEGDEPGENSYNRGIGLAYLDRGVKIGQDVTIAYRKRTVPGRIVTSFIEQSGVYLRAKKI